MIKNKKRDILTDIVLIDIINFSKLSSHQQLEIITFITKSFKKMIKQMLSNSNMPLSRLILGFISTGDGFFCLLNPKFIGFGAILGLSFNHFSRRRYRMHQSGLNSFPGNINKAFIHVPIKMHGHSS